MTNQDCHSCGELKNETVKEQKIAAQHNNFLHKNRIKTHQHIL
jgi:hypothetical protein